MKMETIEATTEAEVRKLMDDMLSAMRAQDLDAITSHYAPDVVAFDAVLQLQFKGVDAYREHWKACFEMCPGTPQFEMHDVNIEAGNDVAFARALIRCGLIDENGVEQMGWMRMTGCYRKKNGKWAIAHEHFSAPFDPESGKALCDLQP